MIKNKRQMFIVISVFALILFLGGTTYAWFSYRAESSDQELIAGDIYMHFNEGDEEITLTNVFPETPEEARIRDDNYITFTIDGKNTSTKDIYYEFILDHGTDKPSPKTRYRDQDLRFDLIEIDGNNETYLLSNVGYDSLVNQRIYVDTIDASTTIEIERHYKLRMWLSDTVIISDTDSNRIYTAAEYPNKYATIKLVVAGDFREKEAPKQAKQLIQSLASTKNYIASYQDVIDANPGLNYTTQDQVSTNATKQTVYYYTGDDAAANANVLFAGYCWQIVRTTDNGGVRMIYNGVAQKPVTTSTPITSSDITYTNDGTYPYTYDADTKKWTSANSFQANTTDTFIFSVNTPGDYAINYKVSSRFYDDYAKIYIKQNGGDFIFQNEHSGMEEGTFDLGTLATTDEIKIEYVKNAVLDSGTDNIIFDIAIVNMRGDNVNCSNGRHSIGIKGINAVGNGTTQSMTGASLYGRNYDYNLATGEFTIEDSTNLPITWTTSDNNSNGTPDYKELIGTYTCLSNSATCNTIYYVGSINPENSTQSYVEGYTIGEVAHFSQIGTSAFNSKNINLAMVGYMFNEEYDSSTNTLSGTYHTNAVWNTASSQYELSSPDSSSTTPNATHHYICDTNCSKVRYYYYGTSNYILLENGEIIEDAIYKMTGSGDLDTLTKNSGYKLNKYSSSIKGYLENWYKKNLTEYTNYLDSTSVYCNDRSIKELGGWNPVGTNISLDLRFYQYSANKNLNCVNETDRFAVANDNAILSYPIGLLTEPERLMMSSNYVKTGKAYWDLSPSGYLSNFPRNVVVSNSGTYNGYTVWVPGGVRGVITLKPGILFESGDGTYLNPYIVGPIVYRNN